MKLFVNLGRNTCRDDGTGILAEAKEMFGEDRKVYVLALEGDRLLNEIKLPDGVDVIEVRLDGSPVHQPPIHENDVFVLNGGTTSQQACMLVHLSEGCEVGLVVNMQREGCVTLARRS